MVENPGRQAAGCAGGALAGMAGCGAQILGVVIHVWTIGIAYKSIGLLGALISAFLPFISQIWWFIKIWQITGTLSNPYCIALLAYGASLVIGLIGWIIFASSNDGGI